MLHTGAYPGASVLRLAAALLSLGGPLLGCQSGAGGSAAGAARESKFPSPAELSQLPPAPEAASLQPPAVDDVDQWTLAGPFPELVAVAPHAPASVFEQLLADAVAQRAGLAVASESMHCAARELGRFVLARQKPPPTALLDFMAARCGAVGVSFRPAWFHGEVPDDVGDDALLARWRPQIEALLQHSLAGGAVASGLWFGREGGRAAVAIVTTQRRVIVAPFAPTVTDDAVSFTGEVLVATDQIVARVNHGALGFAECEVDPHVALPRFRLSCPIAPGDPLALIEVGLREPGRILAIGALSVLARREGEPALTWQRRSAAAARPAATPEEFAQALSVAIGRVRGGAELRPLGLSLEQSREADELVPHVIADAFGAGSPALADLAVLGLIAGWEVGGPIKDAALASVVSEGELDADRWLETALARPGGRAALLDPNARVLAVGTLISNEPRVAAAIAVTYQLFGEEDFAADAQRVFERVAALRAARGRPAPEPLAAARASVDDVAAALPKGRSDPRSALDQALASAARASRQPLQGWVLEASRLDQLALPEELLDSESLRFAVAVSYYQPDDDPWGHYVALIIASAPGTGI